jgi:hypothetical protein
MKRIRIIITALIMFMLFSSTVYAAESLSIPNIKKHIKELSSKDYRGRLVGDKGNIKAQDYISNQFKSIGLEPLGDNGTYFQSFDMLATTVNGPCQFNVIDNYHRVIKKYTYGVDFRDSLKGIFRSGMVTDNINFEGTSSGKIVIETQPYSFYEDIVEHDKELMSKGVKAVIYTSKQDMNFRSGAYADNVHNEGLILI